MQSSRAQQSLIFAIAAAVTCLLFINFCALIFQCGCHSLWNGADALCNIHRSGVRHCPWCTQNPAIVYAPILTPQALISFWPARWPAMARLGAAVAAFPVFGGVSAAIYGLAAGYWAS